MVLISFIHLIASDKLTGFLSVLLISRKIVPGKPVKLATVKPSQPAVCNELANDRVREQICFNFLSS